MEALVQWMRDKENEHQYSGKNIGWLNAAEMLEVAWCFKNVKNRMMLALILLVKYSRDGNFAQNGKDSKNLGIAMAITKLWVCEECLLSLTELVMTSASSTESFYLLIWL